MLQDVDPKEISPWRASRVRAALTLQKALVQRKEVLHLIRMSLAMLLGQEADLPKTKRCAKTCLKR